MKPIEHPLELDLSADYERIAGIDEAGRGPLCGPVAVAGVVFPKGYSNPDLNDSKKLSDKKRQALYLKVVNDAVAYRVVMVDPAVIDELNIYRATQKAMEEIAAFLNADLTITDAMPLTNGMEHQAVVKGDAKSLSVAAASILAKVSRDAYMEKLDALFPGYGLARHKGYPTKAHLEAIECLGVQDFYRRSYAPVRKVIERSGQPTLF